MTEITERSRLDSIVQMLKVNTSASIGEIAETFHVSQMTIRRDLQKLVEENRQHREAAAGGARLLLEEEVAQFLADARAHDAGPAIRELRRQADAIRLQTLEQARRMLLSGKSSDEVIEYLANTLTNRLMHTPTQALRQASESTDPALAQILTRLLVEERDR